jgi:hypothetical protein
MVAPSFCHGGTTFFAMVAPCFHGRPSLFLESVQNHGALMVAKTAEWDLFIQAIPEKEGYSYKWNIFDVTKVVSQKDYPLIPIGTMVLNRTVDNFFA